MALTTSQPGVRTSWWTLNSYVLSPPRSESTCFSVADLDMASAEVVVSALLQLKNNARLFEKWRDWPAHTFKANGKMFRDTDQLTRDET